jgi:hypothetical protein
MPAWAAARGVRLCALVLLSFPATALRADEAAAGPDPTPPLFIHFCWTNCFTLQRSHGLYTRVDGSDETWSIERFTPESVVLTRHDAPAGWNGFSAAVTYAGQVSNGQLLNVTVDGKPVPAIRAAWGSALDTLPADNAERDRWLASQRHTPAGDAPPATADAPADTPTADIAPPPLPDDDQPPCPVDGYLWTPGYWSWSGAGYDWVPGAWVQPPRVGVLWTPGYWGFVGAVYVFHRGYWGPHVGYYGGVNYGHGYGGAGFSGGHWVSGAFAYNRTVSNVNIDVVHNLYHEAVPGNVAERRISYDRGPGGPGGPGEASPLRSAHAVPTAPAPIARASPPTHPNPPTIQRPAVFHPPPLDSPHPAVVHSATPSPTLLPRPSPTPAPLPPAAAKPATITPQSTSHPRH